MRVVLRVPAVIWDETRRYVLARREERMGYLLARATVFRDPFDGRTADLWVNRFAAVPDEALSVQSAVRVEVGAEFQRAILTTCYEHALSLIDVHSHPFCDQHVSFSHIDTDNMRLTNPSRVLPFHATGASHGGGLAGRRPASGRRCLAGPTA